MLKRQLLRVWFYLLKKLDPKWIESDESVLFVQGSDPGIGTLRVTGNLNKVYKNFNDPNRKVTFQEAYDVVFGKGTSTFIEERIKTCDKDGFLYSERQFRIAGLTRKNRVILVVLTTRDNGLEKRVITAWPLKRKSKEFKKLLKDCPHVEKILSANNR